jgi:hypothetical protein
MEMEEICRDITEICSCALPGGFVERTADEFYRRSDRGPRQTHSVGIRDQRACSISLPFKVAVEWMLPLLSIREASI